MRRGAEVRRAQKISLLLARTTAAREQRTKFSSLSPFALGPKNKMRLKEPTKAGIYLFQPVFLTVFPAILRANSVMPV